MKSHPVHVGLHSVLATVLIVTFVALTGPAALAQRQVESVLFGSGKYENLHCEQEESPGTWASHSACEGAWRWTNHTSGMCTEVVK